MFLDNNIYLGLGEEERVYLPLNMANRHGLIAGAALMLELVIFLWIRKKER